MNKASSYKLTLLISQQSAARDEKGPKLSEGVGLFTGYLKMRVSGYALCN